MPRLFLGLELPEHQCQQLLALQEPIVSLRWQTAAQLHLTVRFIGDVQDLQVAELTSALAALDAPAFLLQLGGVVTPAPLQALREQIDLLISPWCAADPQRFVPHVTLARCGSGSGPLQGFLQRRRGLLSSPWQVKELCLFNSDPGSGGSRYSVLARYPLEG